MTLLGQELQAISFLLAQGKNRSQNTLNKKAALFTLRAKTVFSPKDATPQRAFCGVIGRFNATSWYFPLMVNECPKGGLEFEDIGASFRRRGLSEPQAKLQQSFGFSPNGLDQSGKVRPAQCTIFLKSIFR
jgi:hypothetical protein